MVLKPTAQEDTHFIVAAATALSGPSKAHTNLLNLRGYHDVSTISAIGQYTCRNKIRLEAVKVESASGSLTHDRSHREHPAGALRCGMAWNRMATLKMVRIALDWR